MVNNLLATQVTQLLAKLAISVASMALLLEMFFLPSTQTSICLLILAAMLSLATGPSSSTIPLMYV